MTKLVSTYAGATGLLIDKPYLAEHFYPQPFERYITLQTGSAQAAKCYSHWQEVVAMLKPILDANRIAILLLGGKDDPLVNGVHDLRGKTSYLQSHYLVKRALLHVGNDSWVAHAAGWNYRPLVALYGSTDPQPHGPYWYDVAKTTLLVSHRHGGLPTYVQQESPKTIDLIRPEDVCNAVLRHLGITEGLFTHITLSIGALYQHVALELIPNAVPAPGFLPDLPMTVRMDHHFDEQILAQVLATGRKVNLITRRALNLGLLQAHRAQVLTYAHEIVPDVDEPPVPYTDAIRSLFPATHAFFTRELDEAKVAAIRFTYFDHVNVALQRDTTKEDWVKGALTYLNRADTPANRLDIEGQLGQATLKTNRYVLSASQAYVSYAHLAANQPTTSLAANTAALIDDPTTWRDSQHMLIAFRP